MLSGICDDGSEDADTNFPAPSAPIGLLDFVNNTYVFNTVSYTISQVVDHDEWRTDNTGLSVPGTGTGGAAIILTPFQTFMANCLFTIVIECQILNATTYAQLYTQTNTGQAFFFEFSYDSEWYATADDGNPPDPFVEDFTHTTIGIHKLAVVRSSNSNLALSIDGNSTIAGSEDAAFPIIGFPITLFTLGGYSDYSGGAIKIRKVWIYDVVSNSSLPSLST